ncbi:chlorohydrolase [Streptococcus mitis 18/56]|uniref:Chlorohydrolase n=1 Tax=Streptococcus mitis 18/56 TaxID=1340485 RepID=S7XKM5_STRMT|nr:chlorohydrolase [Streptococcus mitis 18/56]
MKIKEQTRKLAAGCSKHCFEIVDGTDVVSNIYLRQGDVTRFEEIFEEHYIVIITLFIQFTICYNLLIAFS